MGNKKKIIIGTSIGVGVLLVIILVARGRSNNSVSANSGNYNPPPILGGIGYYKNKPRMKG